MGVTITIKGTTKGVTTDSEGKYELDVNAEDIVVYSYIGYKTQEILAKEADRFAVVLQPESQEIENVVVVAFGTQKKESVVASVSTVAPGKLRIPASNLTSAFAGQLAGVIAYQRSGEPGLDDARIFPFAGVTSFGAGKKDPLILIDGIEMSSSDLARLNVDDIGSFSVMKDASAAALYGARGANGVILVTTKLRSGRERAAFGPGRNLDLHEHEPRGAGRSGYLYETAQRGCEDKMGCGKDDALFYREDSEYAA